MKLSEKAPLFEAVRQQIDAYRAARVESTSFRRSNSSSGTAEGSQSPEVLRLLDLAWESMCAFWSHATLDELPERPDEDSPALGLCMRLVYALEPEGFDPDEDDDQDVLEEAARYLYELLPADRDVHHLFLEGDKESIAIDLLRGRLILSPVPSTFRREAPKIGRNARCQCGSGKKHKHCCLRATA